MGHLNIAPFPPYRQVADPLLGHKPDEYGCVAGSAPIRQAMNYLDTWAQQSQEHRNYVDYFLATEGIDIVQVKHLEVVYPKADAHMLDSIAAGTTGLRFAVAVLAPATNPEYSPKGIFAWAYPSASTAAYPAVSWTDPASIYNYFLGQAFQYNLNHGADGTQVGSGTGSTPSPGGKTAKKTGGTPAKTAKGAMMVAGLFGDHPDPGSLPPVQVPADPVLAAPAAASGAPAAGASSAKASGRAGRKSRPAKKAARAAAAKRKPARRR